jgi:hypothetical protein
MCVIKPYNTNQERLFSYFCSVVELIKLIYGVVVCVRVCARVCVSVCVCVCVCVCLFVYLLSLLLFFNSTGENNRHTKSKILPLKLCVKPGENQFDCGGN